MEYYIEKFNGKVRLIRNSEREGLIRTRSKGALNSRGEVILFLDAHCEVGYNWLPPLIAPIARDRYYIILLSKLKMLLFASIFVIMNLFYLLEKL